jgi:Na+/H+ antiporter NhaD/arsenite permease-like protein
MPGNPLPLLVFLAVIAGVIFTVIKDVKITLFGKAFRIDFSALPLTGVLVLLVCQSLSLRSLWRGVAGDDAIRPYSILTLFMSLAYISVSVDKTGIFAWMALSLGRFASSSTKLFFIYYVFSAAMVRPPIALNLKRSA